MEGVKKTELRLWPTVVELRHHVVTEEFNAALVRAVEPRELYPPVEKEIGGKGVTWDRFDPVGWHGNLFAELAHVPEMMRLKGMFEEAARDYLAAHLDKRYLGRRVFIRAWANRYEKGMSVCNHDHGAAHLTATYYAQIGPRATLDPLEGCLILTDPRGGTLLTTTPYGQRYVVPPTPGLMVVMPGYLRHETGPFHGTPARIAISADIAIQPADMRHYNPPFIVEAAGGQSMFPHHLTSR